MRSCRRDRPPLEGLDHGAANAGAYAAHFERSVRPRLESTGGFVGATVERVKQDGGGTELVVVTRWEPIDELIDVDAEAAAHVPWFNETRAPRRTAILMVESAGVVPTAD